MVLKIIITIFVIFVISRVFLRYRDKSVGLFALVFWTILWGIVLFFAWLPRASDVIARLLGLSRGVEALLAIAVVILFYAVFRLYVKLEFIEHEITSLVRSISLREKKNESLVRSENQKEIE